MKKKLNKLIKMTLQRTLTNMHELNIYVEIKNANDIIIGCNVKLTTKKIKTMNAKWNKLLYEWMRIIIMSHSD